MSLTRRCVLAVRGQIVGLYRKLKFELSLVRAKQDAVLAAFVKELIDRRAYLDAYPDVRAAGMDPAQHWLEFGMNEGRTFFPDATFYHGELAARIEGVDWRRFTWRGKPVAVCVGRDAQDVLFVEFIKRHFDGDAYLGAYPDVLATGMDPVQHWLEFGINEGRKFRADARYYQGELARRVEGSGWQHFSWRGKPVAVWISCNPEETLFAEFVNRLFDRDAYLDAYPDIRAAGMDPVWHWLDFGMAEGRFLYPGSVVVTGDRAERVVYMRWQHFLWRGTHVAVRDYRPIRPSVAEQIRAQARHDPSVLAVGWGALTGLRQLDGPDLLHRGGFDVRSLFGSMRERPDTIVIIPHLRPDAAGSYGADLVGALSELRRESILVVVTDDTGEAAQGWERRPRLAPLRSVEILLWRDACGPNNRHPMVFARWMNALRPSRVVVIESRLGLDMFKDFGRALSNSASLCCVYFGLGAAGTESLAGARFPRRTMPYALTLTDNMLTAESLRRQWGELSGPGIALLPRRLEPTGEEVFAVRKAMRRARVEDNCRTFRWAWVASLERADTAIILAELARKRPTDQFDVFYPSAADLEGMKSDPSNIGDSAFSANLAQADFSRYDAVLFASRSENTSNVTLEMSQHAIPMLLADVGGAHDTFDDAAVIFVQLCDKPEISAARFAEALDKVVEMTPDETDMMIEASRLQTLARHSPDIYLSRVAEIFGT